MATLPLRPPAPARPAHDEWGVYDPEQAGLTALFARLDLKESKAKAEATAEVAAKLAARKNPQDSQ